jgi:hypothetical protein
LVGKYEGKRNFGRPRHRWEDNIKIYFRKIGWNVVGCIHLAHDKYRWRPLVKAVMNLRVPYKTENFLTSYATIRFSRRTLLQFLAGGEAGRAGGRACSVSRVVVRAGYLFC